jgi:hypothetical protein
MSSRTNDDAFRQAAELENGNPISAGPRIFHVRTAAEKGRAFYVDLSAVPESRRAALISQIRELVNREGSGSSNPVKSSPSAD